MRKITPIQQLSNELQKLLPQQREDLLLALVAFLRFQQKTHLHEVIEDIALHRLFEPPP